MKTCVECGEAKNEEEFYKPTKGHPRRQCKKCIKEYNRVMHLKRRGTPDFNAKKYSKTKEHKQTERDRFLKATYGIMEKDYEMMFRKQNGACAICSSINLNGRRLHIDHDHKSGRVRGLLCSSCNVALGHVKENISRLHLMQEYIERWNRIGAMR